MSCRQRSFLCAISFLISGVVIGKFSVYPETVRQELLGTAGMFALAMICIGFIVGSR